MERLGRYQLLRSLASGGMGEIYLAEHTGIAGFAKRVALKRIRPELARDTSYVQLFLNEARVGSFLNHPNIVHIFDVGHADGQLWLVMEYVSGVDLKRLQRRAVLAGAPLPPAMIAWIVVEVLAALAEAHAGGPFLGAPIVHRDMSPENILIARSGAVKVLDFGLAKWMPASERVPSMEGNMIFGKVRYMPPEQLKGHFIDARADLFSLGVVMYEALHGALPFGRGSANQVLANIMAGPPPSPTKERYGVDHELDAIILQALEPRAEDRFQTAEEMRETLVEYLRGRPLELPMETLRRKLKRGSPLTVSSGGSSQTNPGGREEHTPTEIALSVAERCGKCGGDFSALFLDGMIVDRCNACRGVWLDHSEIDRILGQASESAPTMLPGQKFSQAPLDELVGSCPTCRVGLVAHSVPGQPASLEICPNCFGVWFDHEELRLLSHDDVVTWLRYLLDSLRVGRAK
jgi:serine/threonine protein kinase